MKNWPALQWVALVLVISALSHAESPLSVDDLQKLYTDGNYKELIPAINKLLALKGTDAAAYNKYDLVVMKGDACLHTHSKSLALDAFKSAVTATDKSDDIAVATATAELIRASSSNLTYTQRTKTDKSEKPEPIDIVAAENRKRAFAALEVDLAARAKPRVDAAVKSNSLQQVAQAATDKNLTTLSDVEIAATGTPTDTQAMLGDLGNHASTMMDSTLDQLSQRLNDDLDAVNHRVHPKPGQQANPEIMSVPHFVQDATGIESDARQISQYAQSMSKVFGSGTDLKPVEEKAKAVHDAAEKLVKEAKKAGY